MIKSKYTMRFLFSIMLLLSFGISADLEEENSVELAKTWANTKMSSMSLEEKVGQLIMMQVNSGNGKSYENGIKAKILKYHIGSLAFFKGNALDQAKWTIELQNQVSIPLLIAMDAEWGLGMRLKNTISFPKQITLGAIQDNRLIYKMGKEIGRQMKAIGAHLNFSPVIDLNSIPNNPVINYRSFGQDKKDVSRKSYAMMKGLQDEGIIACAKHFPGHGSTDKDSHLTLPTVNKTEELLRETDLFPFRLLFSQGVKSVMTGHLFVPALDDQKNRPSSLSSKIVDGLLRKEMEYEGLVITDALGMKGVTDHFSPGNLEVEALLAGNDILLGPKDVGLAFNAVVNAVRSGKISEQSLNSSVMRILIAKFEAGLFFPPEIDLGKIESVISNPSAKAFKEELYRNSLTYLKASESSLPIRMPASKKIGVVVIGSKNKTPFQYRISDYTRAIHVNLSSAPDQNEINRALQKLSDCDEVILSFQKMDHSFNRNFGITKAALNLYSTLKKYNKTHVVLFGSPYGLKMFDRTDDLLVAYENDPMAQDMAAQALFGSIDIKGKLPVDASPEFLMGSGHYTQNAKVLAYALPEKVGLSSDTLEQIEDLVEEMIRTKAAPGCQVLVAKDGHIIYDRAFGYHTYKKERRVNNSDIYDLASVTKIMATTLASMKLYEKEEIDIFKPMAEYIEGCIDTSNKSRITTIEALTHHAGLKPWIAFYTETLDTLNNKRIEPSKRFYRNKAQGDFTVKVADKLYINKAYADSISKKLYGSPLRENKNYRYSDLGLYMVRDLIKETSGTDLDEYVNDQFYAPLDLIHTGFNPLERYPKSRIPPTEMDSYFRMQKVQGTVHDMGAAMLGGVSGHAGLFSNSKDLAVLMQMLLNKGVYANKKYFDHKTIYTFTTRYHRSSRRGIGFDMKELDNSKKMNMSELAPSSTFGHLGFTGTCVFADPDNNIVYIFLSNRTFPSMNNSKFSRESYRSKIQSVIYKAFVDKI